jgi:hypothetical protein
MEVLALVARLESLTIVPADIPAVDPTVNTGGVALDHAEIPVEPLLRANVVGLL